LANGEYVAAPRFRMVEGVLMKMNEALDEWRKGVSGEKIVVEL